MITYEVTATVREDLCDAYERYLRDRHIPDLLATGAFAGATLSRSAAGRYRIRYEAHDAQSLAAYLRDHAARLRNDFAEHFPDGVELTREEWSILASWPPGPGRPAGG